MENYKLPKNIRQIGGREERIRIYLEDYVNTYIHQFEQDGKENVKGGVLLGEQLCMDGANHLFIRGAIAVDDPLWKNKRGQEGLQDKIRLYFPNLEVCGWFVCDHEDTVPELQLIKIFEEHFREDGQVLLRIQGTDEDFYARDSAEGFHQLAGYYIYYERNDQMQEYMIAQQPPYSPEQEEMEKTSHSEKEPAENLAKKRLSARKTGIKETNRTLQSGRTIRQGRRRKRLDSKQQNSRAKKAGQQTAATQSPKRKHSGGKVSMADIVIRVGSLAAIFLLAFFIVTNQTNTSSKSEKQTAQVNMVQASVATQVNSDLTQNKWNTGSSNLEQSSEEQSGADESDSSQTGISQSVASQLDSDESDSSQTGISQSVASQSGSGSSNTSQSSAGQSDTGSSNTSQSSAGQSDTGSSNTSQSSTGQSDIGNSSTSRSDSDTSDTEQVSALVSGKGNSNATDITDSSDTAEQAGADVPSLYTIIKGESLESISKKFYGSTDMVEQICAINGISNSDYIQAGDKIWLP